MSNEGICTRACSRLIEYITVLGQLQRSFLALDFDSDVYNYVDTFEAGVDQFANATISYSKKLSVASTKPVGCCSELSRATWVLHYGASELKSSWNVLYIR